MKSADRETYSRIKSDQRLNCTFEDYPANVVRLLVQVMEANDHFALFTIHYDGSGRLEIKRKAKMKDFTVLVVDFVPMPDNNVRESITFRHQSLCSKVDIMEEKILEIFNVLRKKNPSLLLSIQKKIK